MVELPENLQEILEWVAPALALIGGIMVGSGLVSYNRNALISVILSTVDPHVFGIIWWLMAVKPGTIIGGAAMAIIGGVLLIFLKINEKFLEVA